MVCIDIKKFRKEPNIRFLSNYLSGYLRTKGATGNTSSLRGHSAKQATLFVVVFCVQVR